MGCCAFILARTHSAHRVSRSNSNTRCVWSCFGIKPSWPAYPVRTRKATSGNTKVCPTMLAQKKGAAEKPRLFFPRNQVCKIRIAKSKCLMTYAALETTGRTKSMRSILAATPYTGTPSPGNSDTRRALALARTKTDVPRSLSAGSEKVSSSAAP